MFLPSFTVCEKFNFLPDQKDTVYIYIQNLCIQSTLHPEVQTLLQLHNLSPVSPEFDVFLVVHLLEHDLLPQSQIVLWKPLQPICRC